MTNNKITMVLCEGESEVAYIQELNRYLRENEYNLVFIPKLIGSGFYSEVYSKFKNERKNNPKMPIKIMLDDDIYVRNESARERENSAKFEKSPIRDEFLFNVHNFEDFLMLHYDDSTLNKWLEKCAEKNHAANPMHSEQYVTLFKEIFPDYQKGDLLFSPISQEMLDNLFRHNEDAGVFVKSSFASYLKSALTS